MRMHTIVSCCAKAEDYGPSSGRDAAFPTAPECVGAFALAASALLSDPCTLLQTLVALLRVTSVHISLGSESGRTLRGAQPDRRRTLTARGLDGEAPFALKAGHELRVIRCVSETFPQLLLCHWAGWNACSRRVEFGES